MKFVIEKETLQAGINYVAKATSIRGVQPVLANILIETVDNNLIKFCATDLDISIETKIEATVENAGSITLPAKKLTEIISKLPNKPVNFTLDSETNHTQIKCSRSKFDLVGIPASEFPDLLYPEYEESINLNVEPLLKAIKQTSFATADYDSNNVLSGVFCLIKNEYLEMAATDGNRLARIIQNIETKLEQEYSVIIPSRILNEFIRLVAACSAEYVDIIINSGMILFNFKDIIITSRLLDGQYPKYQQLIPADYAKCAFINREDFILALERTSTMVNERTNIIRLNFNNNILNLSADTPDLGDSADQMEIEYDSEDILIAFNYKYMLDTLKAVDTEKIKLEMGEPLAAALIKPDSDEDYLCLVMPVQIK